MKMLLTMCCFGCTKLRWYHLSSLAASVDLDVFNEVQTSSLSKRDNISRFIYIHQYVFLEHKTDIAIFKLSTETSLKTLCIDHMGYFPFPKWIIRIDFNRLYIYMTRNTNITCSHTRRNFYILSDRFSTSFISLIKIKALTFLELKNPLYLYQ